MENIGRSTYFTMVIAIVAGVAAIDATYMPFMAGVFPGVTAAVMFVLAVAQVIQDVRKGQTTEGALDIAKSDVTDATRYRKGLRALLWIAGLYLAIILLGFKVGGIVFLAAYLKAEDKSTWIKIVLICAGMYLLLDFFRRFLDVWWPVGFLGDFLEESLPWLF
jgi:TRAP-type C4-dicarboxylate transport system permease large subunit